MTASSVIVDCDRVLQFSFDFFDFTRKIVIGLLEVGRAGGTARGATDPGSCASRHLAVLCGSASRMLRLLQVVEALPLDAQDIFQLLDGLGVLRGRRRSFPITTPAKASRFCLLVADVLLDLLEALLQSLVHLRLPRDLLLDSVGALLEFTGVTFFFAAHASALAVAS